MTVLAHINGIPVEEALLMAGGASSSLVAARVWLAVHLRRVRGDDE